MRGNGSGSTPVDMAAYDRLPAPLRCILRQSPRSYSPSSVRAAWMKSGLPATTYAIRMAETMQSRFPDWKADISDICGSE